MEGICVVVEKMEYPLVNQASYLLATQKLGEMGGGGGVCHLGTLFSLFFFCPMICDANLM